MPESFNSTNWYLTNTVMLAGLLIYKSKRSTMPIFSMMTPMTIASEEKNFKKKIS